MFLPSHAHVECILNGHRITEWADNDPPYSLEFNEQVHVYHGHDGALYPMSSSDLGGSLSFYVVPHSKDSQWLLDREKERQKNIITREPGTEFNGILQDVVTGIKVSLERGFLISTSKFPSAGQPFEATFTFERMIPEYESTRPFVGVNAPTSDDSRVDIDRQDFPGTGP
ncbi:MAG: hypothetical protein ISN29_01620 [Gammaproteobacteria bacterium AqS3]|nr:hypothetical protein [Gammaproteobacteria bacterium AqS3]